MKEYIDFRSDTVTKPTREMLEFMFKAELGDDVYDDDPTVKELERFAADLLGKEAALFVPSGTFANQLAIMTHTKRSEEIIVCEESHIIDHEVGATALLSGVTPRTVPLTENIMEADDIRRLIRSKNIHYPDTSLICIENAHSNGSVMPVKTMAEIKALADEENLPVHLDGARFFNAAAKLEIDCKEFASYATTINLCLSKGLCAPIGSLLIGPKSFIEVAKRNRKLMGGGMRQVGIIAAAGLYGLQHMIGQADIDNANARYLASQLAQIDGISVLDKRLDINMVFFNISEEVISESVLISRLEAKGYKINGGYEAYRLVTHHYITKKEIDKFVEILKILIFI